ncbi:MAG: ABC transporter permease [Candidatus Hydrogenedentota bacterium]|nr:MAG: ABC transporter permease [Candidatus Hydrogenedentota bacterium]
MKGRDLLRLAYGGFRGHRLRTLLSVLGVSAGIAAVVVLTSLGSAARDYITREFLSLGTNLLIVLPGKTETTGMVPVIGGVPHELTLEDAEYLERNLRSVKRMTPVVLGSARARHRNRARNVTVVGTSETFREVNGLTVARGIFLPRRVARKHEPVCVLGATVARELFGRENPLNQFVRVGGFRFRVIGVTAPRGMMLGADLDEMIEVPTRSAMKLFNRRGLFRLLIELKNEEAIPFVRRDVARLIKERHEGEEDITVFTQDALLATFGKILDAVTAALSAIAAISLAVAGIGIMNVMLVAVSERRNEIGLMKALGATRNQVTALFLTEAALLGGFGGAAGILFGTAACRVFTRIYPDFPVSPPLWAVAAAAFVALGVGAFFGGYPARKAARLDPVAALRSRG